MLSSIWAKVVQEVHPHLVTVLGEPGIGKSRLVAAFEGSLLNEALVLHGRCLPYGEVRGYWALAEAVKEATGITVADDMETASRKLGELVATLVAQTEAAWDSGEITHHLAKLCGLDVDSDRLAQVLEEARRGATMQQALPVLWQIERALGQVYLRLKQEEQAQRAFTGARAVITELAQNIDELPLREQFVHRALGSLPREKPPSPRRATQDAFGGLTEREREVAALIAQGKSNREIADILVISHRTIGAHVRNVLSKLGFTSRAQIAVWATEKGLGKTEQ